MDIDKQTVVIDNVILAYIQREAAISKWDLVDNKKSLMLFHQCIDFVNNSESEGQSIMLSSQVPAINLKFTWETISTAVKEECSS